MFSELALGKLMISSSYGVPVPWPASLYILCKHPVFLKITVIELRALMRGGGN